MPLTLNPVRWDILFSFIHFVCLYLPKTLIFIVFFNFLYCTTKMLGAHEWQQDITKNSSWNTDDALECLGLVDNVIIKATQQIICYTVSKPDTVSVKTSKELNTEGPCKSNHEIKVQSILIGGKKLNDAECVRYQHIAL